MIQSDIPQKANSHPSLFLTILLGTLSAFGPLSLDMYLPALPDIQLSLHTSATAVQASISACLIGMAIGQLFIGPWSDRVGRRQPLMVGLVVFTLSSLALIFIHNIGLFLIVRVIQGLAGSAGQVLSRAIARDLFDGVKLTRFYATLMTINGVFPVIAPILGAALVSLFPWQSVFVTLTIIGVILLMASLFGLPETGQVTPNHLEPLNFRAVFKNRRFMLNASLLALVNGALFTYIAASSFIFQKDFHLSTTSFSLIYAFNGLGIALGAQLMGRLTGRTSDRNLTRWGFLIPIASSGLMLLNALTVNNFWLFTIALWIVVVSIGFNNGITTAIAMASTSTNIGTASAVLGTFSELVGGLASPIVGLFGSTSSIPMISLIIIFEIIGLILLGLTSATTTN